MPLLSIADLEKYQKLIQLEKNEEIYEYTETLKSTSIAERKKRGIAWYPVSIINEELGMGEKIVLDIQRGATATESHQFQSGQTVILFSNHSGKYDAETTLQAIVMWVRDNTLRMMVNIDTLPEWLYEGKIGLNLVFNETTFKEMEIALQKFINADEKSRIFRLREVLLGYAAAHFDDLDPSLYYPQLNESQNKAIQLIAAAQDVAIIHGPPGTGKTTTLIKAIQHTIKSEKQVLVVAASNNAVDLLTEKLIKLGIEVVRIGHPARINQLLLEHSLEGKMSLHPEYKRLVLIRKEAYQYKRDAQKFKRNFGEHQRAERKMMFEQAKQLKEYAELTEDYILNDVLNKSQVITATLVGSTQFEVRKRHFNTVFIDEAAQALAPATLIPIVRANRVIFAGDHCQLPPTVKSNDAQKAGLHRSLFELTVQKQPNAVNMLNTQYRMHQQIMQFSNQEFYGNNLIADNWVKAHVLGNPDKNNLLSYPLEFIDTAGCSFDETFNPQTLSISNKPEAELLLQYLESIFEQLEIERKNDIWEISIGIISPYKEQVNLLKNLINNYTLLVRYKQGISINTIDGFQGQERDLIAISMVRSNDKAEVGFLSDLRRMNVALTRAKKKLIVVGNSATLAAHPFYSRWLDYAEQNNAYKSAWEIITI